jgi:hypothetical protein
VIVGWPEPPATLGGEHGEVQGASRSLSPLSLPRPVQVIHVNDQCGSNDQVDATLVFLLFRGWGGGGGGEVAPRPSRATTHLFPRVQRLA